MNYLITGGSGFIPSYVVKGLLAEGHKVVNLDLYPDRWVYKNVLSDEERKEVMTVRGDITNFVLLLNTVKDHSIDKIIHMVACIWPTSDLDPILATQVNCVGTNYVFEAARILGVRKVVWASSSAVFGPAEKYEGEYIGDDAPHYPDNVYGACKSYQEFMGNHYFNNFGVDNIGLRFSIVYGYGRDRGTSAFASEMIEKTALGEPYNLPYPTSAVISWEYVEDTARAIIMASKASKTRTRVFTTGGDYRPIGEAVNYIKKLMPEAKITFHADPDAIFKHLSVTKPKKFNTQKIKEEIGYERQIFMEEGIRRTMNDYRIRAGLPAI